MAAGAASGAINSAITGSDIGMGALTGAMAAGVGNAVGAILPDDFGYQLVGQMVVGGLTGGVVSEIYGGNFWQGFAMGAGTAAAAFLFNREVHEWMDRVNKSMEQFQQSYGPKTLPWVKDPGLAIPGHVAMYSLSAGVGTAAAGAPFLFAGLYFAPEVGALTVRYGIIYILGSYNTYQFLAHFPQGYFPTGSIPVSWGGAAGAGTRYLREQWQIYKLNNP